LDEVVWADLGAVLSDPQQIATALERAQSGAWLPQELPARQANRPQAMASLERPQARLLTASLAEMLDLPQFERKRRELAHQLAGLGAQHQQWEVLAQQRRELVQLAAAIETFCAQVWAGLEAATFEQKRLLVELLIDQVVVTDEAVEIRSVLPISPNGARQPFCQLRLDYRGGVAQGLPDLRRCRGEPRPVQRCGLQHQAAALQLGLPAPSGVRSHLHSVNA
jgi:site-specific DNA recombinase